MDRVELLDKCKEIVTKHRQSQYGTPEQSFTMIGDFWTAYLGVTITTTNVAAMMILLKVARSKVQPTGIDNWIDAAGYAACGCEVATENLLKD